MVFVSAGEFIMGSLEEEGDNYNLPQRTVFLDAFYLDRTEVTNRMFAQFVDETDYQTSAEKLGTGIVLTNRWIEWKTKGADWRHPQGPDSSIDGLENHPAVQVSWDDAAAYCQCAGKRLPTEAEWDKASRGTDNRIYPWGDQDPSGNLVNFADKNIEGGDGSVDDGYQFAVPVSNFTPGASPHSALDMAGNVAEWVSDWHSQSYYAESLRENPPGPADGQDRVLRGGSWSDGPTHIRVDHRSKSSPDDRWSSLNNRGFRCAFTP
jgi:serine/threonine-protein kinase